MSLLNSIIFDLTNVTVDRLPGTLNRSTVTVDGSSETVHPVSVADADGGALFQKHELYFVDSRFYE